MAPRTSWKGFIKLSLVSVPVRAFTAHDTGEEVRLNQLHKECNSRVKYKKVCPEHGELTSADIVSGYEYTKGQYVVIDPQEISKLRKESDKSIQIDGFISPDEIDPMYLAGKTYFLLPDGIAGNRPYALLQEGMIEAGVVAIAQIIMSGREQLVLLRPLQNMLAMSVMSYPKNIKDLAPFQGELEDQETTKDEMALAQTLIGASKIEDFSLEKYEDQYVKNLKKLIQMKVDGEEIVEAPDHEEPKILNLMEALKKSVAEAQAGSHRKMAPSEKIPSRKKAGKRKAAPSQKRASKKTKKKKSG